MGEGEGGGGGGHGQVTGEQRQQRRTKASKRRSPTREASGWQLQVGPATAGRSAGERLGEAGCSQGWSRNASGECVAPQRSCCVLLVISTPTTTIIIIITVLLLSPDLVDFQRRHDRRSSYQRMTYRVSSFGEGHVHATGDQLPRRLAS